ncbi:hypothetical protein EDEG_03341 [Edhazardia aedis USNM 41457]|uniref:Inositol hexakisphosphate and diphosphoinositol-pentakisphosphate kinase n=1 Tax=Edhazardia aedis (strain USNM 41457) TaxID=1003232 RepID=J8ZR99_EDHAE|nr:hypothetical protein EDEG_03341 [Edhazardia aedis USNM 41457]|eukprot:EJW02223.1 hypothetical protein EDEG_03341 [Edhazardia aedis USNM 41457]
MSESTHKKMRICVCIMPPKLNRPHLQKLLDRLKKHHNIEILDEECILNVPVCLWPQSDVLISFYHNHLPFAKVLSYINLTNIHCINDFNMQYCLFDRRVVYMILQKLKIPVPCHIFINRDNINMPPSIAKYVSDRFNLNLEIPKLADETNLIECYCEIKKEGYIKVGEKILHRPFIEKPVNSEDHNIFVYLENNTVRKLFRKKGNVSSEIDCSIKKIRRDRSYIYEKFYKADEYKDIKVYALRTDYAYAESRKAPTVDGIVERDEFGKEKRQVVVLKEVEYEYARRITQAFKQKICGFDILRSGDMSYVIDVNGWSFVKNNAAYYDLCADLLKKEIARIGSDNDVSYNIDIVKMIRVYRHSDRTPKQKIKVKLKCVSSIEEEFVFKGDFNCVGEYLQYIVEKLEKMCENLCDVNVCDECIVLPSFIDFQNSKNSSLEDICRKNKISSNNRSNNSNTSDSNSYPFNITNSSSNIEDLLIDSKIDPNGDYFNTSSMIEDSRINNQYNNHITPININLQKKLTSNISDFIRKINSNDIKTEEKDLSTLKNDCKNNTITTQIDILSEKNYKPENDIITSTKTNNTSDKQKNKEQKLDYRTLITDIYDIIDILNTKNTETNVKIQLKCLKNTTEIILKWGGQLTHAGVWQSKELGDILRYNITENNTHLLNNVTFRSSAENRVYESACHFAESLCLKKVDVIRDKNLLDSTFHANDLIEEGRSDLKDEFFKFIKPEDNMFLMDTIRGLVCDDIGDEYNSGNSHSSNNSSSNNSSNNSSSNNSSSNSSSNNSSSNNSSSSNSSSNNSNTGIDYNNDRNNSKGTENGNSAINNDKNKLDMSIDLNRIALDKKSNTIKNILPKNINLKFPHKPYTTNKNKELQNIYARWRRLKHNILKDTKMLYNRVSEIYDNLKYDITHNNAHIHKILSNDKITKFLLIINKLYNFVIQNEYGKGVHEKVRISYGICKPFFDVIINNLEGQDILSLYFAKESRIYTLFNVLNFVGGKSVPIKEFDYGSMIGLDVYTTKKDNIYGNMSNLENDKNNNINHNIFSDINSICNNNSSTNTISSNNSIALANSNTNCNTITNKNNDNNNINNLTTDTNCNSKSNNHNTNNNIYTNISDIKNIETRIRVVYNRGANCKDIIDGCLDARHRIPEKPDEILYDMSLDEFLQSIEIMRKNIQ